ncbi:Glycosyltransferase involved in cell wall bisynthesis [Tenacibaculum sp. MAR_2009_124]|uniref:glycosyltransferase family 4 protein n=1 Tax=Tenacibaculum sp. MAR_2009_124 TaxID=1250059 RepID=UPI00089AE6B1|nr:glycosyltransferase family 4 protein [Tenacibaculum sp. MAR_2009_124]SEC85459.1 Glycosyltransferase involved in cell wall bisynthesis [Tenacibaculum sp. MAR_2009_124]
MVKKKLHILFLCGWYPSRILPNNGDFIQRHAEAVGEYNAVSVLHIISDDSLKKDIEIKTTTINNIETHIAYLKTVKNPIKKVFLFKKAFKLLLHKIGNYDVVHVNKLYPFGLFALYLKMFLKKPYIISEHWTGYHSALAINISKIERYFSKHIAKKASFICPVSDNLQDSMISLGFKGNYYKVPNVVDCGIFKPDRQKQEIFTIIHASSMNNAHKNISGILNAIKEFSLKVHKFQFLLIGDNSVQYKEEIENLELTQNVKLLGHQTHKEIALQISKAHVFVLFSNYENLPCVILESFSCGTPVISTNVGGISEYFPKDFGVLIKPKDIESLTNALLRVYDSFPSDKNSMHNYAVNNFSKKSIANQFDLLYRKAINGLS